MMKRLGIYEYFSCHKKVLALLFAALTALLIFLVSRLDYDEDITEFLPLGTSDREALSVYGKISGAERIVVLFSNPGDADMTVEAVETFTESLHNADSLLWCSGFTSRLDVDGIRKISDFVYANIPYFLTDSDYERMDSLLSAEGYIEDRLTRDEFALMFPSGGMVADNISHDPLGLFAPVMSALNSYDGSLSFEMYGGCMFTPDMSRAVAYMDSPFGHSETENNGRLLKLFRMASEHTEALYPDVDIHITGGPEIAVGNASRIKKDSIIAICLSVVLIVILLALSFNSIRNILLIFLSIGWGWLFALGGMSLFSDRVSIIVIGISSVILGIAVNYPLHLIAHTAHEPRVKYALKDILVPLVIGNVTTVGAFMALIPLRSTALRDLGLFASLMLAGTIVFVLVCLPHMVGVAKSGKVESAVSEKLSSFHPENSRALVSAVVILTLILAVSSLYTEFDTDISNINYMTDEQKEDMDYFQKLLSQDTSDNARSVYVLSKGRTFEEALEAHPKTVAVIDSLRSAALVTGHAGVSVFLSSKQEQSRRLAMWKSFCERNSSILVDEFLAGAHRHGFSSDAFDDYLSMVRLEEELSPRDIEYFSPLTEAVLSDRLTSLDETGLSYIVDVVRTDVANVGLVEAALDNSFDTTGMNSALAGSLSDNFNYIGWACSLIVFFFLWFSFGSLELAIVSFLPMAVSWLWILGIMALLGIKFNIVNVILATFIFGQGDDYTIFMTEGCQYEYAFRRPILASYKGSILKSALIMFVGMGTLIVARHPAMKSLAQVTIIGMASVVFMAYLIPPLLFRWLTSSHGKERMRPLTLRRLFVRSADASELVRGRYAYKGKEITRTVNRNLRTGVLPADICGETYRYEDNGYGEMSLLMALSHPDTLVVSVIPDEERRRIAEVASDALVDNIKFTDK